MEVSSIRSTTTYLKLEDQSHVGEARRLAISYAGDLGFDDTDRGRIALVVTEAGTNAVLHGAGGEALLRSPADGDGPLELLVIDRGPGIADVAKALQDGYSTAGTPGTGLGAALRMSDTFDLYSTPTIGTVLYARFVPQFGGRAGSAGGRLDELEIGEVCLPMRNEIVCGDAWVTRRSGHTDLVMVADGLGHGPDAAEAARRAVAVFEASRDQSPALLISEIHGALQSTRGAAVAIASLDHEIAQVRYAGVGNISGTIVHGSTTRSMVSLNGTVGHEMRKVQEFVYEWPTDGLLVMHSDGLQTHWRLDKYPGLAARHLNVIAAVLYRDFSRGRDDLTVIAARLPKAD